jgi:pilus assembly protein CpaB
MEENKMKNLLKNRIVVGLLCIITALIICFGLTPMFNDALKSKVELVRVTSEIKKGDQITTGMITTVETGGYNLPSDVVYKAEDVVGKYANADLYKGDYILQSKLSDTPMLKNEYLSKLNGENRAISITIKSFAAGLSGKLERGDIVSLIASDVGEMRETLIPTELQYVEIIATTDSSGNDRNTQEQPKDSEDTELASTITVLAAPEQATLLAELEQTGKLHAALVYRGGSENAQKFLDEQTKVLEALYPVKSEGLNYESQPDNSTKTSFADDSSDTETENGTASDEQN